MDRGQAIRRIRHALRERSGKLWSVRGGRGTAWGWITIITPPKRQEVPGHMAETERQELATLLGLSRPVHQQGHGIPASAAYYQEYVDRAEGREPAVTGTPYWD